MNRVTMAYHIAKGWIVVRIIGRVMPDGYVLTDELSFTGRKSMRRLLAAGAGLALGGVAIYLLEPDTYREVIAGALLAWSVSGILGAHRTFKRNVEEVKRNVESLAVRETLHARLNRIDDKLGIPRVNLDTELPHVEDERFRRIAHYAGLDDLKSELAHNHEGHDHDVQPFWTPLTLGWDSETG